jgi:outer membrane putative beta-barrel porin/alpha-amylase
MRIWRLIIVFAAFTSQPAGAQSAVATPTGAATVRAQAAAVDQTPATPVPEEFQPLEPDRPDVTNGPHIVDVGLLQIEIGVVHSRTGSDRSSLGTPVAARFGITDWLEARVSGDGFLSMRGPAGSSNGMGNVQLGAKLRLYADSGGLPVLSILPTVNLPVASETKGLGSGQADFTIALLTGTDFLRRGHVDVNYGAGSIGAGTGLPRFTQQLVSLSVSADVPGPVTPYVEGFWFSRQELDGGHVLAIDGGAIYVINARLALDGGVQFGLSDDAPPLSAFGGMSVVVGNVLGEHGVHGRQRTAARRSAARTAKGHR